jgi:hypothetical protein
VQERTITQTENQLPTAKSMADETLSTLSEMLLM